jgi:Ser/Thr protein kinase RdoA (MazF antagonist)
VAAAVRTIELAGPVGAGKSSVAEGLEALLTDQGCRVHRLDEFRRGRRRELAAATWFALRRPSLTWEAVRALAAARIPGWHRRLIFLLVLRLGVRLELAGRHLPPDDWLIVDEGWAQRAVNLFAWRDPPLPRAAIRHYLQLAPLNGAAVVIVSAPSGVARERATQRGLPRRLRGAKPARVDRFLDNAREVVTLVAGELAATGQAVIHVDNEGALEATVTSLARSVDELTRSAGETTPRSGVLFQPRFAILPRPDRLAARALARRRTILPSREAVAGLLDRYGLQPDTSLRPTRSPGGRGASYVVETPSGRLLLKGYKPNVGPDAIRGEHSILAELARCGLPAPLLHPATNGDTWVEVTGARYAAFDYMGGYAHPHEQLMWPPDRRTFELTAGSALAAFHDALDGFEPAAHNPNGFAGRDGERVRDLVWFRARLDEIGAAREAAPGDPSPDAVAWVARELPRIDQRLAEANLPRAVIHGDYGPYNLLVRRKRPIVIIDLELSRVDWRLADLAGALPRFAQRRVGFDTGAARRFVAGYRRRADLPASEMALLPDVLTYLSLRRAVVCWTRAGEDRRDRWTAEAATRLRLARELMAGTHPLVAVSAA